MSIAPDNLSELRALLPADLAAALDRDNDLPAAARVQLAAGLRAQLAACAAYIPARLVRAQLARPQPGRTGGAFWEGSLLFADLSGFTALSERLSVLGRQGAEEVSAVVNGLFAALTAEIQTYQGALLKFGGDALTAFFDAEALGAGHAAAAAAAALAMQARMAEFAAVETRVGTFALQLRVGVHSGLVFAAEVGDERHIELIVTGPEVNRVAMAQEIAAPGEVVVSGRTAALLPAAELAPREGGFQLLRAMPSPAPPPAPPPLIPADGPPDLRALADLAARLAALRPYLVHGLPRRFLEAADAGLGEFRPVTVVFANFHDFSAILERLRAAHPADPERAAALAAAVLNAYFCRAQAVVHRYEGAVNKVDMYTHGDKLMALFGAPVAHEDDPTRAVRCALELQTALADANAEIDALLPREVREARLVQKIGINTGTVFAGRVGGATRYEYTVMGPAVNLAARLMSAAADGELLLSPSARAAVGGQFVLEEAPPLRLKGLAEPVTPARALGVADVDLGGDAELASLRAERLIGRDAELHALHAGGLLALGGQGRVLAIVGDAGAGKSRLLEELTQRLLIGSSDRPPAPNFAIYLGDCQSYDQRTPYGALRGPLRDLLGLSARRSGRSAAVLADDVAARVRQLTPGLLRFAPLLGDALGLALPETPLSAALSPQQRHDRLQELIVALFAAVADDEPLLVAIEDAHWADGPSLELLGRLAAAATGRPLLLALTYRPDPPIPAPWDGRPETVLVRLGELAAADSGALLAALLGVEPPPALLPLLERTQGNPFFIEELVRALIMAGVLVRDEAGIWRAARPLGEVELPKSIEGLLIARLDRLDEPRQELVQVASVIGRRFQRPVIEGVYANPAPLAESLERLVGIELIQAEQIERNLAYIFRHALLRDVAYAGILFARRRVLHARVARRIEELSAGDLDPHLPLLAWHYLQAEEWRPALRFHLAAAEQARDRFANQDALALYAAAGEIAERLRPAADPAWLDEQVAAIHEHSGDLHVLLGGYEAAVGHYRKALELSGGGGPVSERWLRLHRLLASVEERRSRYEDAFAWLHTGMARATSAQRVETGRCYLLGAGIYYRQGEYRPGMEWARMGLVLAEEAGEQADQAHAWQLLGSIRQEQGELVRSVDDFAQARDLFERLNHITGLGNALNNLGNTYRQLGRWQETIACYERSLQISENIGDVQATARTSNNLAVVLVGRNQLERAAELYKLSSAMFGRIGSALGVGVTTYNRGEVLLLQDRPAEAMALFARSIADFERINARTFMPEVLRLAAEAALALGDHPGAHDFAARSLAIAGELGMAAEGAAARRVLGQVALAAGDVSAAHDQLAQSREALVQLDNRYELGKTLYQLGRLALARGDASAFAAACDQAAAIFVALDAQRDLGLLASLGWRHSPVAPVE